MILNCALPPLNCPQALARNFLVLQANRVRSVPLFTSLRCSLTYSFPPEGEAGSIFVSSSTTPTPSGTEPSLACHEYLLTLLQTAFAT